MEFRKMVTITLYAKQKKRHRCTEQTFGLWWEKARVGCFKRTALKHVYYLGWNRSPAQAGCMRQVLGPGALGRPRGIGWRGRWEGRSEWGTHVNPWLIHVNVWQNPLQYCKVISLQLIKKNEKKKVSTRSFHLSKMCFAYGHGMCFGYKETVRYGMRKKNNKVKTFWTLSFWTLYCSFHPVCLLSSNGGLQTLMSAW